MDDNPCHCDLPDRLDSARPHLRCTFRDSRSILAERRPFIVAHDTMHGSMLPQYPAINRAIGRFCVFIYAGFSYDKLHENHRPSSPRRHGRRSRCRHRTFRQFWPWYLKFFQYYFGWREFATLTIAVVLVILQGHFPTMLIFWALPAILSPVLLSSARIGPTASATSRLRTSIVREATNFRRFYRF